MNQALPSDLLNLPGSEPRRPRVDPRRPAILTPSGLRRIVLGSTEGERLARRATTGEAVRPLRSAGPFTSCMLVISHAQRGTLDTAAREALAVASLLAPPDTEVVLAVPGPCADDVAALGADRWLCLPPATDLTDDPQAEAAWAAGVLARLAPRITFLPDREADADLGRRLAVALGLRTACPVVEVQRSRSANVVAQLRIRVNADEDALCEDAQLALLAPGTASTDLPFKGLGRPWDTAQDGPLPSPWTPTSAPHPTASPVHTLHCLGSTPGRGRSVALEEADFILAAGQGVTDLALFQTLADRLGAAIGASRVAVDAGHFPRSQQVGATGKTVQATTYVALGISGAVQHLQGIRACRHVVAVNTDASAPIARRASLMVVEDSSALMRELLTLVQQHQEVTP